MIKFLFQGDSITDAERKREDDNNYGFGYPNLFAAEIGKAFPGEYDFVNRGISGNRIVDVYARIKRDIINLKPEFMSILIGVNDVWHEIGDGNGVAPEKFEKIYSMLIEEIKEALPDIKIIILEPFVLKGTATEHAMDRFQKGLELNAQASKRIAEKYNLKFVSLQDKFDEACEKAEPSYWLADGVHPTAAGHAIIKDELRKAFDEINK